MLFDDLQGPCGGPLSFDMDSSFMTTVALIIAFLTVRGSRRCNVEAAEEVHAFLGRDEA